MASSKFSSPFFQKSPLQGAYAAGADGMVTVSYADIHKDFQQGIADNVSKAYAKEKSPCDDLEQKLSDNKITTTAYETLSKKCAKKDPDEETPPAVKPKPKSNKNIPKPNSKQRAAQYGETPPSKSTGVIPGNNSIFSSGMVHQNTPCPPGQSRDPVTGMCGL